MYTQHLITCMYKLSTPFYPLMRAREKNWLIYKHRKDRPLMYCLVSMVITHVNIDKPLYIGSTQHDNHGNHASIQLLIYSKGISTVIVHENINVTFNARSVRK